jgi:hypothetical protein
VAQKRNTSGLRPPWKPGESGNLSGRPRRQPVTQEYLKALDDLVTPTLRAQLLRHGIALSKNATMAEAVGKGRVLQAITDTQAAKEVREAVEGKAPQRMELTGPCGEPMQIEDVDNDLTKKLLGR